MLNSFIIFSLLINIIVLSWVCLILILYDESKFVINAWGQSSPSRHILFSIYISILYMSILFLIIYVQNPELLSIRYMIFSLLLFQIIYKLSTLLTMSINNPIVISNQIISLIHIITIYKMF